MNAIKFIKEHGVEKARKVIDGAPELAEYYSTIDGEYYRIEINAVNLKQLKRLVESVDLVDSYGGIDSCRNSIYMLHELTEDPEPIRQAITDYESIYSDNDMGDDSHIENHISPLCKAGVK